KNEVRRAYNRSDYLEQRRPMMQWWANFIAEADKGSIIEGGIRGISLVG
ncbi:integrase, partial [Providencia stuartii]